MKRPPHSMAGQPFPDWSDAFLEWSMTYWEQLRQKPKRWREHKKLERWIGEARAELLSRKLSKLE